MSDEEYMRIALKLAKKGCGTVSPNPMVGAVIVKNGKIIGEGWHKKCGEPHAERNALSDCSGPADKATMYVTLEPCCHHGRQPPCTEAIIAAGISRVVIGSADPNPQVSGKGISILREHKIEVTKNVLQKECDELNEVFFHYIKTKRPFVVMKYAMTLDGKIACHTGDSKWITGEKAREHVHSLRNRYSAIMVGVNTVISDDPMLNCRINGGKDPVRVICDTNLRTPLTSKVVLTADKIPTVIATCCNQSERWTEYEKHGCKLILTPLKNGHVDLNCLMEKLGQQEIDSVLIEGGSEVHWSALKSGIVNKAAVYISPKLFGGKDAKSPIGGEGVFIPDEAFRLKNRKITVLGDDFLIEGEVESCVYRNN